MKLDFSKLKKNTENQQPINTPQVDPTTQTGIKLSFTEGKTYDLDEIIANKIRDNENGTLVLRTIGDIQFRNRMIELVTKKILDDYGVEWTEDNYKLAETLAKVNNFSRVFDAYFTRYYEEYKNYSTNDLAIILNSLMKDELENMKKVKYEKEKVA